MAKPGTKGYKGLGMEGMIARWYAANTAKAMQQYEALARQVAANLPPGSRVLEVAPGPGYFAIALAKLGDYRIQELDISRSFVEMARGNAARARVGIEFHHGNVSAMPFADESFDFLLCRAAFKNFSAPVAALQEMWRVLQPGGKALINDLRRDAPPEMINQEVERMGMGAASSLFTKLTFRLMLRKRAYRREEFEQMIAQTNFHRGEIRQAGVGYDIWLEREKKEVSVSV